MRKFSLGSVLLIAIGFSSGALAVTPVTCTGSLGIGANAEEFKIELSSKTATLLKRVPAGAGFEILGEYSGLSKGRRRLLRHSSTDTVNEIKSADKNFDMVASPDRSVDGTLIATTDNGSHTLTLTNVSCDW